MGNYLHLCLGVDVDVEAVRQEVLSSYSPGLYEIWVYDVDVATNELIVKRRSFLSISSSPEGKIIYELCRVNRRNELINGPGIMLEQSWEGKAMLRLSYSSRTEAFTMTLGSVGFIGELVTRTHDQVGFPQHVVLRLHKS